VRVAAKISDEQIDDVVADFCRSDGGCLRQFLETRPRGAIASTKTNKNSPAYDQASRWPERSQHLATATPANSTALSGGVHCSWRNAESCEALAPNDEASVGGRLRHLTLRFRHWHSPSSFANICDGHTAATAEMIIRAQSDDGWAPIENGAAAFRKIKLSTWKLS
jgi:hypothetical protein